MDVLGCRYKEGAAPLVLGGAHAMPRHECWGRRRCQQLRERERCWLLFYVRSPRGKQSDEVSSRGVRA